MGLFDSESSPDEVYTAILFAQATSDCFLAYATTSRQMPHCPANVPATLLNTSYYPNDERAPCRLNEYTTRFSFGSSLLSKVHTLALTFAHAQQPNRAQHCPIDLRRLPGILLT